MGRPNYSFQKRQKELEKKKKKEAKRLRKLEKKNAEGAEGVEGVEVVEGDAVASEISTDAETVAPEVDQDQNPDGASSEAADG